MARKYAEIVGIEQLEDVLNKLPLKVQGSTLLATTRVPSQELLKELRGALRAANRSQGSNNVDTDELIQSWPLKARHTWRKGYATGFKVLYDRKEKDRIFQKYGGSRARTMKYAQKAPVAKGSTNISRAMWAIRGPMWLELGSTGIGRSGKWRGRRYRPIRASGWMRRVIDRNLRRIQEQFKKDLQKKLNQFIDRYIRKSGITW